MNFDLSLGSGLILEKSKNAINSLSPVKLAWLMKETAWRRNLTAAQRFGKVQNTVNDSRVYPITNPTSCCSLIHCIWATNEIKPATSCSAEQYKTQKMSPHCQSEQVWSSLVKSPANARTAETKPNFFCASHNKPPIKTLSVSMSEETPAYRIY